MTRRRTSSSANTVKVSYKGVGRILWLSEKKKSKLVPDFGRIQRAGHTYCALKKYPPPFYCAKEKGATRYITPPFSPSFCANIVNVFKETQNFRRLFHTQFRSQFIFFIMLQVPLWQCLAFTSLFFWSSAFAKSFEVKRSKSKLRFLFTEEISPETSPL